MDIVKAETLLMSLRRCQYRGGKEDRMHCVDERVLAGGSEEGTYRSILLNGRDLLCIMVFAALDADEVDADAAVTILGPSVLVLVVIHFAAACALTFGAAWAFALRLSLMFSNLERRLDAVRVLAWAACAWGEQVWSSGNRWFGQNRWLHFCKVGGRVFCELLSKESKLVHTSHGGRIKVFLQVARAQVGRVDFGPIFPVTTEQSFSMCMSIGMFGSSP